MSSPINSNRIQELNQAWQDIASPHVCHVFQGDNEPIDAEKASYKFGEVISKLESSLLEGKINCLFIGRTHREKLPSDNNEAKPNEVWGSADCAFKSPEDHDTLEANMSDRLHLWVDCNHKESIKLIGKRFDKIVVDESTAKGLGDFAKRFAPLLRTPQSTLTFEQPCNIRYSLNVKKPTFVADNNYIIDIPFEELTNHVDDYSEWSWNLAKEHMHEYLKSIYNSVTLHENENYPYTTHYSEGPTGPYFTVSGLKK